MRLFAVRALEFEPASSASGVPSHQFRDFYGSSAGFGDAFGQTQVQLADDLRRGRGRDLEWAMIEHEFYRVPSFDAARLEAPAGSDGLDTVDGISAALHCCRQCPAGLGANLAGTPPAPQGLDQQEGQMLIGAGDSPVAARVESRPVLEPGAASPGGRADLLDHEPGGAQFGE